MSIPRSETSLLLVKAGRLLLEYNEASAAIHRALQSTAKALTNESCLVAVVYGGVTVSRAGESPITEPVHELRFNTEIKARVHGILARVRRGQLDVPGALVEFEKVEAETPPHPAWVVAIALGLGALTLAALLGADFVAAATAGLATAIGLVVRKQLARRHYSLLLLPLAASLIGAIFGGLVVRFGWTQTPGLALVVPALMVIPGPHLINGLLDLIDNYIPMSIARLVLATGILLSSAAGIILGVELTVPMPIAADQTANTDRFNLVSVMALAGVSTCGFAIFYNTAWRHLAMAIVGGVAGNATRFLALEADCRLEAATFLAGLVVGIIAGWSVRFHRLPVAAIAFAGAVTMIPGLNIYRAIVGTVQIARQGGAADPQSLAETLGNAFRGCVVVGGLTLGLLLGARLMQVMIGSRD
jgi:uncharacterized membrane protein YjjP (DUF1212 family)